ncbi:hypothetical protein GOBAR_DD34679 [Gossypium barbadense]|nr:hypothetical protein GOBAR_DD34679 [Gossypium barbadense]
MESKCGEKVSAPCFCCAQHCGFYLHKNNLKELEHVTLQHPLISTENRTEELEDVSKCLGCWEPLANILLFYNLIANGSLARYAEKPVEWVADLFMVVLLDKDSYEIVENEDEESPDESVSSITKVLERNDAGEATVIQHFKHIHYFILSDRVERRDPNLWFYHCAICDTSAHVNCVLGEYPFIKLGSTVKVIEDAHEHPLTFVKKIYDYPNCRYCGERCLDFALECTGCNFIAHNRCPRYNCTSSDSEE